MDEKTKYGPINSKVLQLGAVVAGAPATLGTVRFRLSVPSCKIHASVEIGIIGDGVLTTSSWSFWPVMIDPDNGSQSTRMQPVKNLAALPDGYEAESGVKFWEGEVNLGSTDTDPARIFAVIIWEEARGTSMCMEERAYWYGKCTAERVTPLLNVGGSL